MKWFASYAENRICKNKEIKTVSDIKKSGYDIIEASVPGNFELDMIRLGKFPDFYYSDNTFEAQRYENLHVWYFSEFETDDIGQHLRFEGIDTIADIYVNGEFVQSTDNMFLSYDVYPRLRQGRNEVVVHIKPVVIEARKYNPPAFCSAMRYNTESLYIRKAPHSYGWDIMPRILTTGLWKPVTLLKTPVEYIENVFFATHHVDCQKNSALIRLVVDVMPESDFASDYTVKIRGVCGASVFEREQVLTSKRMICDFNIENCSLWWPKGAGEPALYDVEVSLYRTGRLCDTKAFKTGIRTVRLDRTDYIDKDGNGRFCFEINGKKIFVLGTNWVPLDAYHSNDVNRLDRAFELLLDIGCNCVRCWGGNVYEADRFYDLCDEHGILVWQDFSMACAVYPNDEAFAERIRTEAVYQIKRLRNHPSVALWSGDNECDNNYVWWGKNPQNNILTREVIKAAVEFHDFTRPYLPSSPLISTAVFEGRGISPEEHLWGPRDYFKGDYYRNSRCCFASETGYHGFPSVSSLKKFLKAPERIFEDDGRVTSEYLAHATCMTPSMDDSYAYRIGLACSQVETLFGKSADSLSDFVKKSQISQAEAKKYFIEKFRIGKWYRSGIIWWNLLDGWPQVSDAVVDYYYTKKLAYHYIKRSQLPLCLMFDEPEGNMLSLYGVNDLCSEKSVVYSATRVRDGYEVLKGEAVLQPACSAKIGSITIKDGEKEFYLIKWTVDGAEYKNHYFTNIIEIDFKMYMDCLKKCGMDEFED